MRAAPNTRPSVGLSFLSLFFVFGALMASLAALGLLFRRLPEERR